MPADVWRVVDYYERAIELYPRFAPAYDHVARILGQAEPWRPKDRSFVERGAQLFPDDAFIRITRAMLTYRDGDAGSARAALAEILRDPDLPDPARAHARQLEETWKSAAMGTSKP